VEPEPFDPDAEPFEPEPEPELELEESDEDEDEADEESPFFEPADELATVDLAASRLSLR
jgi:hypothetical protein